MKQHAMLFILSICQVVVPDSLLHFGVVGNRSPTPALEESLAEEELQIQTE